MRTRTLTIQAATCGLFALTALAVVATSAMSPISVAAKPKHEPPPIDLKADSVIYGDETGSNLTFVVKGKAFFDFNGDGVKDFLASYWTRAFHPTLRHQHLDVVFGQAEWPAVSKVSDLPNRMMLQFPHPPDILPSDPLYSLNTIIDIDGDKDDDLAIAKTTSRNDIPTSYELRFYYGKKNWSKFITVADDPPDFIIRQSAPPRNDAEKGRVAMPDKLNSADMNGDGKTDLLVGSCELKGPKHTAATKGALLIYLGPFGTDGVLDLGTMAPNAVIYSSDSIQVCSPSINDVDGDQMRDLLFTEAELIGHQTFHNGALVRGRTTWDAAAEVEDLVATRFTNATASGDVDVSSRDVDGDGTKDIVGSAWHYRAPRWSEQVQCVWYGGHAFPAQVTTDSCDYRFTGLWPSTVVDVNGDKALDYIFPLDQRSTDPWTWYLKLGPIVRGGEMNVSEDLESADATMSIPYSLDDVMWRNGNVGGSADDDFLTLRPEVRHALPNDGEIVLSLGPISNLVVPPTPTPGTPTTEPTHGPPTAVLPTATVPPIGTGTPAGPPPIDLKADSVIYGDETGSNLTFVVKGKAFFDFNGDGVKDFLASYWTRAFHPTLRHQHLDVVFGQADWPAVSKVSDLPNRMMLQFPHPPDILPSDPLYSLNTIIDIDGDKDDDLAIAKTTSRNDIPTSYELRFFYGKTNWSKFINVADDPPDFIIRQSAPPRNDAEKGRVAMPDKLNSADMNGDGKTDLLVGSCELKGPKHTAATKGALLIYLGPFGTDGVLDLGTMAPNAVIYSSDSIQVCSPSINDVDGDQMRDLLFTEAELIGHQTFHNGALVRGRTTWDAAAEVEDLVATRFTNAAAGGDVDVASRDVDGDKIKDIVGNAWHYQAPRWSEQVQCVWYGGHAFPAQVTTDSCDYRFTGLWPSTVVDVNGDSALDYIFPLDQRSTDPWTWYLKLGPIVRGGEMNVSEDPRSADYTMSIPYSLDDVTWRNGNVGGSADDDFLTLRPEVRHALPNDGEIVLSFGPIVAPVAQPTATPSAATTEPPPVPSTVAPPSATVPPTTEPSPTGTSTRPTSWQIFLPVSANGEAF